MEVNKMSHKEDWMDDARKIPDVAMNYIRELYQKNSCPGD
jgi:hypothetical protein